MRMPPLLADFIYHGACKPICEKSLTLPGIITTNRKSPVESRALKKVCFSKNERHTFFSALKIQGFPLLLCLLWQYRTEKSARYRQV